jgi:hypothetical protein
MCVCESVCESVCVSKKANSRGRKKQPDQQWASCLLPPRGNLVQSFPLLLQGSTGSASMATSSHPTFGRWGALVAEKKTRAEHFSLGRVNHLRGPTRVERVPLAALKTKLDLEGL